MRQVFHVGFIGSSRRDEMRLAQDLSPGKAATLWPSPVGTTEGVMYSWIQSSLRDSNLLFNPFSSNELLGYFHSVPTGRQPQPTSRYSNRLADP